MSDLRDVRSYREALRQFRWEALWALVDGDRARLNLAHECVDRHVGRGTALRLQFADGRREEHSFRDLADWSSRFASFLESEGVAAGDRVAIMLEPSLAFYGALFGTVKRGAVAVPLFTLFGPDGLRLRVGDCAPRLLLVGVDAPRWQAQVPGVRVVAADEGLAARLARESARYAPATAADDLAVLQYTSGTTRALPEAVRHTHRAVVTLMVAALFGVGLRAGDRYFCPSSPAWGHGLWHGTIAPLALGIAAGAYSGRFDADRLVEAVTAFGVTNMAAAPTVYRMLRRSGRLAPGVFAPEKVSFTGEPMDAPTWDFVERALGVTPRGMYGSTEVGVIVVNYPGFADYEVRRGALGRPAPGWEVAVVDERGQPLPPGAPGEIAVRRKAGWFRVKDRGHVDEDGYLHHHGRSDDAIVSAGWTMSALEIEEVLLRHPDVREAAVVGAPDELRGQVAKAYVVSDRGDAAFEAELQDYVKARLSRHEYPRRVERVDVLPKTPAGKIDRAALRDRAAAPTFPTITAEALAALRAFVGKPVRRPEPYVEVATRDAIRHWAHGIGDRNPYWAASRTAPPTILFAMDRIVSGYVGGLPGIHAMYGGADFRWRRPIREDDRVLGASVLLDLEDRPSRFARRAIKQTYRTTFTTQEGAVVCEADSWCFRTERDAARERRAYAPVEPHRYAEAELERIRRAYRAEAVRGAVPRYWEDTEVGEALPEVVKGPLTVTSVIAFVQGWGSLYVRGHGLAFDLFDRHPALGVPNAFGVPEPPERVHWDEALARAVGVPGAYDYGPERVAWLGHLVTNWMGDAGFLRRLHVQVRRHNLIGDTTWCRGTVAAKTATGDGSEVTLDLAAVNQRGETVALGQAVAVLPRRT